MATLQDIADAAHVSTNTVSRILSGDLIYRRPTFARRAERIRKLAHSLGYRPNGSARAIRSGRCGTVCLLLSTIEHRSHLPAGLLDGLQDALDQRDLHLMVARLSDETLSSDGFVPKVLREYSADGLLINYTDHIPPHMIELIRSAGVPAVWMNVKLDADCLYHDDEGGAFTATQHLIATGHRRIAYLQTIDWDAHYSTTDRTAGYRRAMEQAKLEPLIMGNLDGRHLEPSELVRERRTLWLRLQRLLRDAGATAVVAYSPLEFSHAVLALRGLRAEQAKAFVGITFRDVGDSDTAMPYPCVVTDSRRMGREAVAMLDEKIKDAEIALPPRVVAMQWVE